MGGIKSVNIATCCLVLLNHFKKRMEYTSPNVTWAKGFMVELSSRSCYVLLHISFLFQWLKWWESNFSIFWCLKGVLNGWFKRLRHWNFRNLEARAFVFEFLGEIVNNGKLAKQLDKNLVDGKKPKNYALPLDGDWALEGKMTDDEALCLDPTVFRNFAQFLNHRCEDTNLLDMLVKIETHNPHYYRVHVHP